MTESKITHASTICECRQPMSGDAGSLVQRGQSPVVIRWSI